MYLLPVGDLMRYKRVLNTIRQIQLKKSHPSVCSFYNRGQRQLTILQSLSMVWI